LGPISYPETSVRNYHYSFCNSTEERSCLLLRGGSLKSRIVTDDDADDDDDNYDDCDDDYNDKFFME